MKKQRQSLSEFDLEKRPVWAWIMRISAVATAAFTPLAFLWPPTAVHKGWSVAFAVAGFIFLIALGVARSGEIVDTQIPGKLD